MKDHADLVRGKGNVFREFEHANADAEYLKSILAAQIIKVLDARAITVRQAQEATSIAAADFSRIRRAKLDRFTIDRLMNILGRLDQKVEVKLRVHPKRARSVSMSR